ncbi:hypothetical protein EVAR_4422_1 [Eumeta japonica]|uniref:Uncharacterized protein n=1 Tax=Eumeta variegata TaxID=151549 RepID=A0A4C1T0C4_EUMVA|nr:hypothetical protein EVAR_4422_1 [Eumeta japonica]
MSWFARFKQKAVHKRRRGQSAGSSSSISGLGTGRPEKLLIAPRTAAQRSGNIKLDARPPGGRRAPVPASPCPLRELRNRPRARGPGAECASTCARSATLRYPLYSWRAI